MKFVKMVRLPINLSIFSLLMILAMPQFVLANTADAQGKPAYDVVKDTADSLVKALNYKPERFKKDPSLYEKTVREILVPSADFTVIAKKVMGKKYYTEATTEQREKFISAFRESLIKTYSTGLELFDNQEITVMKPSAENLAKRVQPIDMEVKTSDGTIFPLRFSMRKNKQGEWKVVNIIINGVNVGKAYRNHFSESVNKNNGNIDQVIATWSSDITSKNSDLANTAQQK